MCVLTREAKEDGMGGEICKQIQQQPVGGGLWGITPFHTHVSTQLNVYTYTRMYAYKHTVRLRARYDEERYSYRVPTVNSLHYTHIHTNRVNTRCLNDLQSAPLQASAIEQGVVPDTLTARAFAHLPTRTYLIGQYASDWLQIGQAKHGLACDWPGERVSFPFPF